VSAEKRQHDRIAVFRFLIAVAAAALSVLLLVPAALAKENVRARLDTPIPLQAVPGKKITVAWTLYSAADRRPFGAGGVFIRLLSASGGEPVKAHAQGSAGRFVARVVVPEGGIGGIEIGLEGISYFAGRTEDADLLFPIDGNPFAAHAAQRASSTEDESASGPSPLWFLAGGSLALVAGFLGFHRRRVQTQG
jgi:hypothetical protein